MRYDDASQTGSMAQAEPVARPDVDNLPAGSFGPATGNAISGAGTTSGTSGADTASAPPASIIEVHGAGGQTVQANGAFQAIGQYGVLSMDAQGDFQYVRNAGTPDGVQDVFNYTIADASGANASTTLTIDIGQVAAAAAGQGIVNLPPGVELSDIHVNGRDLVIDMPDGTQMVIPGGAVFVPQLMVGDVQIPPTNLAALLIDSEPQPAAGPPQSSGGNFAEPVPPLDPGAPLGDLIPPTELSYTPPQYEELANALDHKPTVIIETPDNPAGLVDASESVSEKGLPARNGGEPAGSGEIADGNGANNSDSSETNTGTIVFTAEDGLDSVTVDGTAITAVGQQIQGQYGVMTITGIDLANGQITYSYTLSDNTSGDATQDVFTIVVTDDDGDTATGSLTVHIVDDVPTALDDTDTLDVQTQTATGNVMTGVGTTSGSAGADTVGADNATLTAVSGAGGSDNTFDGNGNLVVHGTFGTLTIDANGQYTYVLDEGSHGGGTDVFTYTLTDGDGDIDTATLTITIPVINTPPTVEGASVNVSEEGLAGGLPDNSGSPDTTNSATASGNIGVSDVDGDALTITLGVPAGSFTSGNQAVNWAVSADGHTLVGYTGSDSTQNHVIEISINNAGEYTVNLIQPFDDPVNPTEDSIDFTVPVSVNDGTDTVLSSIHVTVEDDAPVAANDTDTLDTQTLTAEGNVLSGAGTTSGSAGADHFGADGPGSLTAVSGADGSDNTFDGNGNLVVHGAYGTLTIDAQGQYTYVLDNNAQDNVKDVFTYTIVDADGDTSQATLTITVPNLNEPPTAGEGSVHVSEEGLANGIADSTPVPEDTTDEASVTVLNNAVGGLNVSDPDGDPLTITLSDQVTGSYSSGGVAVAWTVVDNGHELIGYLVNTDPTNVANQVITVTVQDNGNYTVTLLQPFDDPDASIEDSINFTVPVTVSDGQDSTSTSIVVTVEDDSPTLNDGTLSVGTVYEDGLVGGNQEDVSQVTTATINSSSLATLVNSGADTPLTFSFNSGIDGTDTGMTEDGVKIVWNVIDATHVEGVLANDASHQVFTVTDNGDGTFTFTLLDNIDNSPSGAGDSDVDTLSLDGLFVATDADGDHVTLSSGVSIDIQNDVPTLNEDTVSVGTVYEDGLAGGNQEDISQVTTATINASSIAALVNAGADNPVTISFNGAIDGTDTGMTEDGVKIVWNVIDATHVEGVLANDATHQVFTVTDNGDGTFTFTLLDNIDNTPTAAGDSDVDALSLDGLFVATDTDGDAVVVSSGVSIDIQNDVPTLKEGTYDVGTVYEDGLPGGNQEDVSQVTTATINASSLAALVNAGADNPVTISFNAAIDGTDTGMTEDGVKIVWNVIDGTHVEGVLANDATHQVFTVTDNADGTFTFTLLDHIDNTPTAAGDDDVDSLSLDGLFVATDTDGDAVVISAGVSIDIQNDVPVTFIPDAAELENDTGSILGVSLDTGDGDINNNVGADTPGVVRFPASLDGSDSGLTSNGATILYALSGDGQTLYGYVEDGTNTGFQSGEDDTIFTITLHQGSSTYDVVMDGHVDAKSTIDFNDGTYDFVGGNDPWAGFVPLGQIDFKAQNTPVDDDSQDLLLTPFNTDGTSGDSINGNANSAGVNGGGAGQNIGSGEGIRLDFVTDLVGNPAGSPANYDGNVAQQDHHFDGHYNVNDVSVKFGDGQTDTTISIEVFDNTDSALNDYVLGVGDEVSITKITISYDGENQEFIFDPLHPTDPQQLTVGNGNNADGLADRQYTVTWVDDGGGVYHVQVTGILDTNVRIATTGESDYQALEIAYVSGDDFAVTGFGAVAETTDPVNFQVPVELVDSDGDTVAGTPLDITIDPVGSLSTLTTLSVTNNTSTNGGSQGLGHNLLASSNDNHGLGRALGAANRATLMGALAAAGLEELHSGAAAHPLAHGLDHGIDLGALNANPLTATATSNVEHAQVESSSLLQSTILASRPNAELHHARHENASPDHGGRSGHGGGEHNAPAALDHGTHAPAHGGASATQVTAPTVVMPSAQQLAGAGHGQQASVDGNAPQHNEVVGKVLADALHGGEGHGPNIDALINALADSGHGHANQALEALASHGAGAVPFGHMGFAAAFGGLHSMHFDAAMHQDAAPTHG